MPALTLPSPADQDTSGGAPSVCVVVPIPKPDDLEVLEPNFRADEETI